MALRAVKHTFTGLTAPITSYDYTKTSLGSLMVQKTGLEPTDKYVGPLPVALARPMEESTATTMMYPHVLGWSSTTDWVFLIENSAAASATRRIYFYEYNSTNSAYNWKGFITATLNTSTAHTIRALRATRYLHSTGTASASGTAVTGIGSNWVTERVAVGARIGFGSTDPTAITTWYVISAIGSNTGITLASTAGTVSDGAYVIEELRFVVVTSNATTTNGGVFVVKGVNYSDFTTAGTTIAASASTVDNLKLVYWLADAATVTNTAANGGAVQAEVSKTSHTLYVLNGTNTTTARMFVYNLRANDAIAAGKMTLAGANIVITGNFTVTGTIPNSTVNNGRIATLAHGPQSGVESFYFVTLTRLYVAPLAGITAASTTWTTNASAKAEVPTGSTSPALFATTSNMWSVEVMDSIDRLVILTSGATAFRHYVTRFPDSGDNNGFDHIFGFDDKQQDQASAGAGSVPHFNTSSQPVNCWSESGITHIIKVNTAATLNHMYALPFGAHWTYASATNQRVITPSMSTPNCAKFDRVVVSSIKTLGYNELSVPLEPYRVYYRTANITTNATSSWTLLDKYGSLSGASASSTIQFMLEFCTIGWTCIPARIMSLAVLYEDETTDSHYTPSATLSSIADKRFAWRFSTAFGVASGGVIPDLRIRLFNAESGDTIYDDDSVTQAGTWEISTNGGSSWSNYNTNDKSNETTYLRYTRSALTDGINVRALLTQL